MGKKIEARYLADCRSTANRKNSIHVPYLRQGCQLCGLCTVCGTSRMLYVWHNCPNMGHV
jgi:hypothetical protein